MKEIKSIKQLIETNNIQDQKIKKTKEIVTKIYNDLDKAMDAYGDYQYLTHNYENKITKAMDMMLEIIND